MAKRWEQLATNVLGKIFDIFPEMIILIGDDGFVATANSKGLFEDLDDVPIWTCQGTSCKPSTESISTAFPYQAPVAKRGGKGKGKGRAPAQWNPQYTTSYLPSLRVGTSRPPGVVAQETRSDNVPSGIPDPIADREFTKKIDICRWSGLGSGWEKVSNLPLTLTEATATVSNVADTVSDEAFEGNSVLLLDADYLKVMGTASTRGILPGYFLEHRERAGSVRKSSIGSNYLVLAIYKVQGIINCFQCYPFQLIWGHCVVIDTLIHL